MIYYKKSPKLRKNCKSYLADIDTGVTVHRPGDPDLDPDNRTQVQVDTDNPYAMYPFIYFLSNRWNQQRLKEEHREKVHQDENGGKYLSLFQVMKKFTSPHQDVKKYVSSVTWVSVVCLNRPADTNQTMERDSNMVMVTCCYKLPYKWRC